MLAIQGCSRSPKELTLNEIAQTIEQHFTWYGDGKTNWKASIRHALSLHKIFRRRSRRDVEGGGRGGYWHLDFSDGEGTKRSRKRTSRAQRFARDDDDFDQSTEEEPGSSESVDDDDTASTGSSGRHAPYPAASSYSSSSTRGGLPTARGRRPDRLGASPLPAGAGSPGTSTASPPQVFIPYAPRQPPFEAAGPSRLPAGGISRGGRASPAGQFGRGGLPGGAGERDARFAPAGSSTARGAHIRPHGPAHRGGRPAGEPAQDRKGKGRG
ncbi:hypothetical protein EV715DRAFT_258457 [Schizophyllum commune]